MPAGVSTVTIPCETWIKCEDQSVLSRESCFRPEVSSRLRYGRGYDGGEDGHEDDILPTTIVVRGSITIDIPDNVRIPRYHNNLLKRIFVCAYEPEGLNV